MPKTYYIGHIFKDLKDGGQSRNNAFKDYFEKKGAQLVNVYSKNLFVRIYYALYVVRLLLFSKKNKFFLHQGSFLILFPLVLLKYSVIRNSIFRLLQNAINKNSIILEVNDLTFEQATDLNLPVHDLLGIIQNKLYSLKRCRYIFASNNMTTYIQSKYLIQDSLCSTIINGSKKLKVFSITDQNFNLESDQIKYLYAGSLDKDRQVEDLINLFQNKKENLILLGENGEWINEISISANIHYLGKYEEDYAQFIASTCDIGLIPYESAKFYYNLCYPTKASFYICSGIPFLSTPLNELKNVFKNEKMTWFIPFAEWEKFLPSKEEINEKKEFVKQNCHQYYWASLLSSNKTLNNF